MTIAPGSANALATQRPPILCGTLTGQHGKNRKSYSATFNCSIKLSITNTSEFYYFSSPVYLDAGPPSVTTVATITTVTAAAATTESWRVSIYITAIR